jgi:hypothetical protein
LAAKGISLKYIRSAKQRTKREGALGRSVELQCNEVSIANVHFIFFASASLKLLCKQ